MTSRCHAVGLNQNLSTVSCEWDLELWKNGTCSWSKTMIISHKIHICINYTSETTDRSSLFITKNVIRRRGEWGQKRPQHGIRMCCHGRVLYANKFFFDWWVLGRGHNSCEDNFLALVHTQLCHFYGRGVVFDPISRDGNKLNRTLRGNAEASGLQT